MENTLSIIRELYKNGGYDDILEIIHKLKGNIGDNLNPELLVYEGMCIQLSDKGNYTLKDAEDSFKAALDKDNNLVSALIELAYYHFNVEDDCKKALTLFLKAWEITDTRYKEIIEGLKEIAEEENVNYAENVKDTPFNNMKTIKVSDEFRKAFINEFQSTGNTKKNN